MITTPGFTYTAGTIEINFRAGGWSDAQGDLGQANTQTFKIQGPTATMTNPRREARSTSRP